MLIIYGDGFSDFLGDALANVGDVDFDGKDDLLVGDPGDQAVYLFGGR
jgi:hypothetical protein